MCPFSQFSKDNAFFFLILEFFVCFVSSFRLYLILCIFAWNEVSSLWKETSHLSFTSTIICKWTFSHFKEGKMGLAEKDEWNVFSLCILLYFWTLSRKKKFSSKLEKKKDFSFYSAFPTHLFLLTPCENTILRCFHFYYWEWCKLYLYLFLIFLKMGIF